jgi:hypothetical protein
VQGDGILKEILAIDGQNKKTDFKGTGWESMESIHLAKDRDINSLVGNTVMNHCVPKIHIISKQRKKY